MLGLYGDIMENGSYLDYIRGYVPDYIEQLHYAGEPRKRSHPQL